MMGLIYALFLEIVVLYLAAKLDSPPLTVVSAVFPVFVVLAILM